MPSMGTLTAQALTEPSGAAGDSVTSGETSAALTGIPVVAVTAWQMLFEYANLLAGELCLVHGAAGNVGAYAVHLAHQKGIRVVAMASANDTEYLRDLGADQIDYRTTRFDDVVKDVDPVTDLVGGETADRSASRCLSRRASWREPTPSRSARGPRLAPRALEPMTSWFSSSWFVVQTIEHTSLKSGRGRRSNTPAGSP
jgi:hypothetical protein